jgi:hypothetical protein
MPKERTEAEMISRSPLKVQLGGKDYDLPILNRVGARKWRELLMEKAREVLGALNTQISDIESLVGGLSTAMMLFPDKTADLIQAWSPELAKEALDAATDEELSIALQQIIDVAFPYGPALRAIAKNMQLAAMMSPASAKFTN